MHGTAARIGGGFLALAAIWIGVYWFWEPGRSGEVTFAPGQLESPAAPGGAAPDPIPVETDAEPETEIAAQDQTPPPGTDPATPPPGQSAVISPEFRDYTVRDGDSFSSISRRYFGTTRHADAIAAANPFVSPENLRGGQKLRVPVDPENVQGRPAPGVEDSLRPPETIEYGVVKGDTLSEISQRFYGSLRYAEVIFNANRDVMSSMDDLQIGDVLKIPSRESVLGESDR